MRVFELETKAITGIDSAGKPENPAGLAIWRNVTVKTTLLYEDNQIFEAITQRARSQQRTFI
jgi:hypothetical protein